MKCALQRPFKALWKPSWIKIQRVPIVREIWIWRAWISVEEVLLGVLLVEEVSLVGAEQRVGVLFERVLPCLEAAAAYVHNQLLVLDGFLWREWDFRMSTAHKKMYKRVVLVLCMQCHGVDMTWHWRHQRSAVGCITTIHLLVGHAGDWTEARSLLGGKDKMA